MKVRGPGDRVINAEIRNAVNTMNTVVSKKQEGGGHFVPLNILGLRGFRVPILFGNDLLWNGLPYSKGFVKFGCL